MCVRTLIELHEIKIYSNKYLKITIITREVYWPICKPWSVIFHSQQFKYDWGHHEV